MRGLQVARDVGLRAAGGCDEGVHMHLTRKECLEQAQPHWLREHGKAPRHVFECFVAEGSLFRHAPHRTEA